jgi:2-polyprenyl-6-hydroxyphenyl methylase/3-demethylubiquinone-9 3-methyltransferase
MPEEPVPISSQNDIRAFFDALASDYRDLHGPPERLASYRLKLIDRLLAGTYRGTLLEIGCGTGIHLFALAPKFKRAIGVDLSPAMIEEAARQSQALGLRDKVELFPSSAETLAGVQDLSIDVALMVGVLEHVPDKAAVFKALKRVLKPQGCLICLTPNAGFCYYRWRERKHKPWKILSSDEFLDATQVSKLVEEAGLKLTCLDYWRFVPRGGMPKLVGFWLTMLDWPGKWLGIASLRGGLCFKAVKPQSPADGRSARADRP